jgi:hypothetical protein
MAAKFSLARIAAIFVEVCKISNHSLSSESEFRASIPIVPLLIV